MQRLTGKTGGIAKRSAGKKDGAKQTEGTLEETRGNNGKTARADKIPGHPLARQDGGDERVSGERRGIERSHCDINHESNISGAAATLYAMTHINKPNIYVARTPPLKDGVMSSGRRIVAFLPTICCPIDQGPKVVFHLLAGRRA